MSFMGNNLVFSFASVFLNSISISSASFHRLLWHYIGEIVFESRLQRPLMSFNFVIQCQFILMKLHPLTFICFLGHTVRVRIVYTLDRGVIVTTEQNVKYIASGTTDLKVSKWTLIFLK